ncbi:MAG: class 1 fructose-bisphosphatase, partial [Pseudonocardia sp.]|nr:class 1 fructose-bisphosphatase [Pseudonocardia sp.]
MLADHTTLAQFLIEERRRHPTQGADLDSLVLEVALACKAVAQRVALGALHDALGRTDRINVH